MMICIHNCPACLRRAAAELIETHKDPVAGGEYRISRCLECDVVFSEPRIAVDALWYEKSAPLRAEERRPAPESDWRYRHFLSEGLPPGRLLDVGCGDGGFLRLAREHGFLTAGFDYEKRMVDLARSRGITDAECATFDEYCRSRNGAEFDYVTLFDVLEHSPEPSAFLSDIKRLIKPGGYLAVTLPNACRPLPWGREEHDHPPCHFTRWTPEALCGFLERHGFEVMRQEASNLMICYLADNLYFRVVMPGLLSIVRRLMFGRDATVTISELYSSAPTGRIGAPQGWRGSLRRYFADKQTRQNFVDAFKLLCAPACYPIAVVFTAYYRLHRSDCGNILYTLARRGLITSS